MNHELAIGSPVTALSSGLGLEIGYALPTEAGAIVGLISAIDSRLTPLTIYGCSGAAEYVARQIQAGLTCGGTSYVVGRYRGNVVACAEMRRYGQILFVNHIVVEACSRWRGIGRVLLQSAIQLCNSATTEVLQPRCRRR